MKLPAPGSCQCGAVTYEVVSQPIVTIACHCADCQKLSASAFSISIVLPRDGLRVLTGELKSWERPTAAGGTAICWFCPDCGNRVFHENPAAPQMIRLKPGGLEDTSQIEPMAHTWTCRQQPWFSRAGDLPRFKTQPDLQTALAAIAAGEPIAGDA